MTVPGARGGVRLAELLAALSLATDLGRGQPAEHTLRQCLIALRLAERLGMTAADRVVVYYASLVAGAGCHVDAYEQAKWFGDDTAVKTGRRRADFATAAVAPLSMMRRLGAGRPAGQRARLALAFLGDGRQAAGSMPTNHWLAADGLAARLGLGQRVRDCVEQTFERWDGRGAPRGRRGEEILLAARLVGLADVTGTCHRAAGGPSTAAAVDAARQRSGTQFDPALVDRFAADAGPVLDGLDDGATWQAVIDAEPGAGIRLSEADFDSALEAIADFTDVKSPYTSGHSRGVADLAAEAARIAGLEPQAAARLRRAGLVHDLGRLGVPNTIWDKKGRLSHAEAECVRTHPCLTERTLAASPALAPLAAIAVLHHERLDGSGYPRGLAGRALPVAGRL
ncbi:MAG TPA: HD domain-containing phosphohydrolase, partial [Streptosporangiaceae bacterium]|nr:HD domain-containing phosphohydrolase [Streptosporangiaceae bacterium]